MAFSRGFIRLVGSVAAGAVLVASAQVGLAGFAEAAVSLGALSGAGPRPNATRLSFTAGDRVKAQVDVGSGDLYVTYNGLTLQGVNGSVGVGAWYNSAAVSSSPVSRLGKGWGLDYTPDVRVKAESDSSVTYYGPGGLVGNFPLVSGSTTSYTSAKGFKSDLVKTSGGWELTQRSSKIKRSFNLSGELVAVTDRNGNKTTVSTATGVGSGKDVTVTSAAGPVAARTATVTTDAQGLTRLVQPGTNPARAVAFTASSADSSATLTSVSDALGRVTSFGYTSAGLLTSITAPGDREGTVTRFGYDSSNRVTAITQVESSVGGPGDSTTRLDYTDGTQTLLAEPVTDQSQAISAVPHTSYSLDSSDRVTAVTDAMGRKQSKTYTANFDTASSTAGNGAPSTTTNTYAGNGGDSLTKSQSPTGASDTLEYNTAAPNQYLPSKGTDRSDSSSTFTYNGAGNTLSSSDAAAAKASVDYNSDGTPSAAAEPNNGTNKTTYAYTDHQVTSMTPVTGASLGGRAYTYDGFGRLASVSDGRGKTTTYAYDLDDRVTSIGWSGGFTVNFEFNTAGQVNRRSDNAGTATSNFDQLGRMTSTQNSAFGGVQSYTYDKNSRLATSSSPSSGGTVTYGYDNADQLSSVLYPAPGGGTKRMQFGVDSHNRRVDTWLDTDATHSTWVAHQHTSHDTSDRVTSLYVEQKQTDGTISKVLDVTYCYLVNSTPGTCSRSVGTTDVDYGKLVWKKNNTTGLITTYGDYSTSTKLVDTTKGYDKHGRLIKAAQTGTGAKTATYTYNSNGARTSAAKTGTTTQNLTYNAADQITSSGYTYDSAGNLTAKPGQTMTYTDTDQLATVTKSGATSTYTYSGAANNELVAQTTPTGSIKYAYGHENPQGVKTLEQVAYTPNGGATTNVSVINDPRTGQPLLLHTASGLQAMTVNSGDNGSLIALVSNATSIDAAYDYDPYGVPSLSANNNQEVTDANPYTFAGGIKDPTTGWVHFAARYYDPTTGSFTQQDTLDAPLDPNNANRYAYAGDDPINNTDPSGNDVNTTACVASILGAYLAYNQFQLQLAYTAALMKARRAYPENVPVNIGKTYIYALLSVSGASGALSTCKG